MMTVLACLIWEASCASCKKRKLASGSCGLSSTLGAGRFAIEQDVPRPIDHAHAAAGQTRDDIVALANNCAN